ncbi:MAG: four helix bundle protein [Verrucomicrobiota bacterium]
MHTGPKDLKQRTKSFAIRIIRMYARLPKTTVAQVLGKQVLRSGTSVGANYCEANRARSKAEFISKMGDCLKELDETMYWLELLVEADIVSHDNMTALIDETRQITAIFVSIINHAKQNV